MNDNSELSIIWVGLRQSDICESREVFDGSICIFGDKKDGESVYGGPRCNPNPIPDAANRFIIEAMRGRLNDNMVFMLSDPDTAYTLPEDVRKNVICLNSPGIMNVLSDKALSRFIVHEICMIPPSAVMSGYAIKRKAYRDVFGHLSKGIVLQERFSSGGFGTIFLDSESSQKDLDSERYYVLSSYIDIDLEINVTMMIGNVDWVVFPPSRQIMKEIRDKRVYCGSDYSIVLDPDIACQFHQVCEKICRKLNVNGYRGIIGADFFISKEGLLYFSEFNCRFQGSSAVLDFMLKKSRNPSLYELNIRAFRGESLNCLDLATMDTNIASEICFANIDLPLAGNMVREDLDGYDPTLKMDGDAYLYRRLFRPLRLISHVRTESFDPS